ncbi:MAG: ABC transporter permease [Streptosporangiaceae bacterium]
MTAIAAPTRAAAPRASSAHTFRVMLARDVRVLRREFFTFLTRTIMQPLLFVFVFAYVLPQIGPAGGLFGAGGGGGPTFSTILVPGMVAIAMVMNGVMAVTMPLIMELSYTKEIEDRLLAPLPVWALGLEKIAAGAIQSLIAGLVVFPVVYFVHAGGQAPSVRVDGWGLLIAVMAFAALLSSSLGLLLGTLIDPRKINVLFSLIMMPAMLLGCVYYPWAALGSIRWLQIATLINPLVYVSEGLRTVLTPVMPHMYTWAFLTFLIAGTAVAGGLAMSSFRRRVLSLPAAPAARNDGWRPEIRAGEYRNRPECCYPYTLTGLVCAPSPQAEVPPPTHSTRGSGGRVRVAVVPRL